MTFVRSDIRRLLQYKICLLRLNELGVSTIYSHDLGEAAGVTAVQVRKDFSNFKIKGKKRGGYNIVYLLDELERIFGNEPKNIIIFGMGNIGNALVQYNERFIQKNIHIIAGFDIDPAKQNKNLGIPVYSPNKLKEIVESYNITTAIIAVPFQVAQEVSLTLLNAGIKGILNFAPVVLKVPDEVVIDNINLSNRLEGIMFNVNSNGKTIHDKKD
jgi:redox-sensing transcriptional repressor